MKLNLIDENGEIIQDITLNDGEYVKLTKGGIISSKVSLPFTSFLKLNHEEIAALSPELSDRESSFILYICPYVGYGDNCIKSRKGRPLNIADIADNIGCCRSKVNGVVNSLIDKDILCKAKNSKEFQLYMNPWICGKGNTVNRVLQTMFKHYKIRSRGGITWERLIAKS